jgi:hypothetical protein
MKREMKREWLPHIIAVGAFVVFIVLGLACATSGNYEPDPSAPVDLGLRNDVQNRESMSVKFQKETGSKIRGGTAIGQFCFEISYRGDRSPDTLLLRIDNGTPITLRVSYANTFNPGMREFAIPDVHIDQLLNCNNSINLEFNNVSDYIREWSISASDYNRPILKIKECINSKLNPTSNTAVEE